MFSCSVCFEEHAGDPDHLILQPAVFLSASSLQFYPAQVCVVFILVLMTSWRQVSLQTVILWGLKAKPKMSWFSLCFWIMLGTVRLRVGARSG